MNLEEQKRREKLDSLLLHIGAVAEMQDFHFQELLRRGFTRSEALELVKAFTATTRQYQK